MSLLSMDLPGPIFSLLTLSTITASVGEGAPCTLSEEVPLSPVQKELLGATHLGEAALISPVFLSLRLVGFFLSLFRL